MDLQLVKGLDKLGIKVIHNVAAAPVKGCNGATVFC